MNVAVPESPLFWSDQGIFADMPSYGLAGALPSLASPPRTPEAEVDEIRGGGLSYVSAMPQCNEGSPPGDQKLTPTRDERNEEKAMGTPAGERRRRDRLDHRRPHLDAGGREEDQRGRQA